MIPIIIGAGVVSVSAIGYATWRRAKNQDRARRAKEEAHARQQRRQAETEAAIREAERRVAAARTREREAAAMQAQAELNATWAHIARVDRQMTKLSRWSAERREMVALRRQLLEIARRLEGVLAEFGS